MESKFTYRILKQENFTSVEVTPHPDWDEFKQFVTFFIKNENANLVAQDYGMDRHQARYRILDKQFILQYEHYSNSIWIETDY